MFHSSSAWYSSFPYKQSSLEPILSAPVLPLFSGQESLHQRLQSGLLLFFRVWLLYYITCRLLQYVSIFSFYCHRPEAWETRPENPYNIFYYPLRWFLQYVAALLWAVVLFLSFWVFCETLALYVHRKGGYVLKDPLFEAFPILYSKLSWMTITKRIPHLLCPYSTECVLSVDKTEFKYSDIEIFFFAVCYHLRLVTGVWDGGKQEKDSLLEAGLLCFPFIYMHMWYIHWCPCAFDTTCE